MPTTEELRNAVERLADKTTRTDALHLLELGGEHGIQAAIEGLSHPDWQVRRWCAAFMDHNSNDAALERLRLTLNDAKAKVRLRAVHSISCEPCKPGQQIADPVPLLLKRLKEDPALRVRRHTVCMLAQRVPDHRIARAFKRSLSVEVDPRLVRLLRWGLALHKADTRQS